MLHRSPAHAPARRPALARVPSATVTERIERVLRERPADRDEISRELDLPRVHVSYWLSSDPSRFTRLEDGRWGIASRR